MASNLPPFDLQHHPLRVRRVHVLRSETLSPRMRRLVFGGVDLEGFVTLAPEDHVKLFFPAPGESVPAVPTLSEQGRLTRPEDGPMIARDYTPRSWDPEAGELTIDFYLHGDGIASRWAAAATEGSMLGMAGPRGSFVLRESYDWHLFVADETALPEVGRRVDELDEGTLAVVVAKVDDAAEERLPSDSDELTVHWARREDGVGFLPVLRGLELPEGRGFAWLAGEATEVRAVKEYLLLERGFDRSRMRASGHWKRGVVNHDHHEPVEAAGG